jgi:hypothetical protein
VFGHLQLAAGRTEDLAEARSRAEAALASYAAAWREMPRLVKDAKELLPKHQQEVITETLQKADQASRIAEVKLAQDLRCQLCQCTWPPQIMRRLSAGDVPSRSQQIRWKHGDVLAVDSNFDAP